MKRIFALLIMALMVAILLPSCTENQRAKRFGGKDAQATGDRTPSRSE